MAIEGFQSRAINFSRNYDEAVGLVFGAIYVELQNEEIWTQSGAEETRYAQVAFLTSEWPSLSVDVDGRDK